MDIPHRVKSIAIIGAGFSGLLWANALKKLNYDVTIFEKTHEIGGIWLTLANNYSCVQVVEPEYNFANDPEQYQHTNIKDFTPKISILAAAKEFASDNFLYEDIQFGADIINVTTHPDRTYSLTYQKDNEEHSAQFDSIVCLPGALSRQNEIHYPNEENFMGTIHSPVKSQLLSVNIKDKEIVITGMGAFAIESAQFCILNGAKKVTLLCRRYNIVFPRYASYLLARYPFLKLKNIIKIAEKMYRFSGQLHLMADSISEEFYSQNVIPPVSDFFFQALSNNKLFIIKDEITSFTDRSLLTNTGKEIPCDVLIKCLGYQNDYEKWKKILNISYLKAIFVNGDNRLVYLTPDLPFAKRSLDFYVKSSSTMMVNRILINFYSYFLANESKYQKICDSFPSVAFQTRENIEEIYRISAKKNIFFKIAIFYLLFCKSAMTHTKYSEEDFFAAAKKQWQHHYEQLTHTCHKAPDYPLTPCSKKVKCLDKINWIIFRILSRLYHYLFNQCKCTT